ncbi:MAG: prepilin-type N-terminal cleavage/methylation domain-containing protein [Pseudomonadota bacterium]
MRRLAEHRAAGFTIVELVVVIVLLGILAAAALPRFISLSDEAVEAQLEGLAGSLRSGLSLFHAAWQVSDDRGSATVDLTAHGLGTLDANEFGYPVSGRNDSASTGRDMDCEDVWNGLLSPAPEIIEADPNKEAGTSRNHIEPRLGTSYAFVAGQDARIDDASIALPFASNSQVCQFISLHHQSVAPGTPKPTIFYDTRTGTVLLDLGRTFSGSSG